MAGSSRVECGGVDLTPDQLAEGLSSSSRRARQLAAAKIAEASRSNPASLLSTGDAILDGLQQPEARTRWELLDALRNLIPCDAAFCYKALGGAEDSLFDEDNGTVRLSAMRFVCKIGTVSPEYAAKVWPLIDEALQCYHGDPEYIEMLAVVNEYALADIPDEARDGLVARMKFDAENPKNGLAKRSKAIIAAAKREQ